MSSSDTNYVLNEQEDIDQYDPYVITPELMLLYSYHASLVNQNAVPVELSCYQAHLALIMPLTCMKIFTYMAQMQYHLR